MSKKKTTAEFITEAQAIHGDAYNYDKVIYDGQRGLVTITCPIHGDFEQQPKTHLRAQGCKKCGIIKCTKAITKTTEQFIKEAKDVHGDKYDYSKSIYIGANRKITITCAIHGDFEQTPSGHTNQKSGCNECGNSMIGVTLRKSLSKFIETANIVHGGFYDYSKAVYVRSSDNIIITCHKHGDFTQIPNNHLASAGCPKCKGEECAKRLLSDTVSFIEKAINVHGDRFTYEKTIYQSVYEPIIITCAKHGDFKQKPNSHLSGHGCQKCYSNTSKAEKEICDFLDGLNVKYITNDRSIISPKEIDIFIPEYNLGIEYCGLYWHQEDKVGIRYHINKLKLCQEKGIHLMQVFEDEWKNRQEAVKTIIKGAVKKVDSVYARKLTVEFERPMTKATKLFFDTYHHSGSTVANSAVVLKEGDEIVFASSFRKHSHNRKTFIEGEWELARVTSKKRVTGGLSRTLKAFGKVNVVDKMVSFCDLRYFTGSGFAAVGFEYISTTAPTPFYSNSPKVRIHQRAFTKTKVENLFGKCETTALAKMKEQGYWRIFDCGHKKFQLVKK